MLFVCYLFVSFLLFAVCLLSFYLSWISDVVKAAGEPGCIRHFVVILLSHKTGAGLDMDRPPSPDLHLSGFGHHTKQTTNKQCSYVPVSTAMC